MRSIIARLVVLSIPIVLSACCTPIKHIDPPVLCEIPEARMREKCSAPAAIPVIATYGDILKLHNEDRHALQLCLNHDEYLKEQISTCNNSLKEYAKRIQELNREFAEQKK
jgi:hypothetical protein